MWLKKWKGNKELIECMRGYQWTNAVGMERWKWVELTQVFWSAYQISFCLENNLSSRSDRYRDGKKQLDYRSTARETGQKGVVLKIQQFCSIFNWAYHSPQLPGNTLRREINCIGSSGDRSYGYWTANTLADVNSWWSLTDNSSRASTTFILVNQCLSGVVAISTVPYLWYIVKFGHTYSFKSFSLFLKMFY